MDPSIFLTIILGCVLLTLISGGVLLFFFLRQRSKNNEISNSSLPKFDSVADKGFIPLNNISSSDSTSNLNCSFYNGSQNSQTSPPHRIESNQIDDPEVSQSFWQGGEGYYVTPTSKNSQLQTQVTQQADPTLPSPALVSSQEPSSLTIPTARFEKENDKEVVYLDGLFESKKWKLKDFRVDAESHHRPKKSNVWRTSYNVW